MNKTLRNLLKIAQIIGEDQSLVQGGGGNISIKDDKGLMYIKSSGSFLREMNEKEGFVRLQYKKIPEFFAKLKAKDRDSSLENKVMDYIENLVHEKGKKPSMEVSMHAFLDEYVIHTHPVYLNVILCSQNSRDMIHSLFSDLNEDFVWMDYVSPGYGLGYKIYKADKTKIYFLENHGLIVTGAKLAPVLQLTQKINFIAKSWLINKKALKEDLFFDRLLPLTGFEDKTFFFSANPLLIKYGKNLTRLKKILNTVLFPDFAVYCLNNSEIIFLRGIGVIYAASQKKAQALHEILLSHIFISDTISKAGNEPKLLKRKDVKYILNMKMEHHRNKQLI